MSELATRDASQDVAVRGVATIEDAKEFVRNVKDTSFVKTSLRGKPYEILACVLAGQELGMGPMESLREIDIIEGRPSLSAKSMQGIAVKRGHKVEGTIGPDSVTITGTRADNGATMTVTWTIEMAKRAGLTGKKPWQQYPEAMLWNRGVSQLCRSLFPDVFTSVKYETGEAEAMPSAVLDDLPTVDVSEDEVYVGELVDEGSAEGPSGDVDPASAQAVVTESDAAHVHDSSSADTFTSKAKKAGLVTDEIAFGDEAA